MDILLPIDGSDCSMRALRFGADFCRRFEGSMHVVHITDVETEATEELIDRAESILADEGIHDAPEVEIDIDLSFRPSTQIGEDILEMVEEQGYDHVIMGHHGAGTVDRMILGSAAETVLRSNAVPVTVIP
ncbi:MAG: universal stress protein [Halobacteriales archaeon]|nr:universal stress protein [Halobacteriales archaeon]